MQWAKCPSHNEEKYEEKQEESGIIVSSKLTVAIALYRNCEIIGVERDCWGRR